MPADRIQAVTPQTLQQAADILRRGGVVGMPTETVYGLAANALDPQAVARVFEIKHRPSFDPLIVHVASVSAAVAMVADFPHRAEQLARRFWPGPLTLVLPKRLPTDATDIRPEALTSSVPSAPAPMWIPDIVTSGLPTVAVRVPSHPAAQALLRQSGVPIAAPSANRFGSISPTRAEHVAAELGDKVDLILDGGPCAAGVESTVISLLEAEPALLRPGGVTLEEIESLIGPVRHVTGSIDRPAAPGMLERHYAPRTPMVLLNGDDELQATLAMHRSAAHGPRLGLLRFVGAAHEPGFARVEVLSSTGDLREAAAHLFAAMRRLDDAGLDLILAQPAPPYGLGLAINDRLRRASAGRG